MCKMNVKEVWMVKGMGGGLVVFNLSERFLEIVGVAGKGIVSKHGMKILTSIAHHVKRSIIWCKTENIALAHALMRKGFTASYDGTKWVYLEMNV
jgi:hypothetical protein